MAFKKDCLVEHPKDLENLGEDEPIRIKTETRQLRNQFCFVFTAF